MSQAKGEEKLKPFHIQNPKLHEHDFAWHFSEFTFINIEIVIKFIRITRKMQPIMPTLMHN
jgi:hypothetical protein